MGFLPKVLAFCLGCTILLETSFALFAGIRGRKNLLTVVLAQIITNPAVVLLMLWCGMNLRWHHAMYELPIESAVVVVEWLLYKNFLRDLKRPFAFSLAANYFSYSFGIVLSYLGFMPNFYDV